MQIVLGYADTMLFFETLTTKGQYRNHIDTIKSGMSVGKVDEMSAVGGYEYSLVWLVCLLTGVRIEGVNRIFRWNQYRHEKLWDDSARSHALLPHCD